MIYNKDQLLKEILTVNPRSNQAAFVLNQLPKLMKSDEQIQAALSFLADNFIPLDGLQAQESLLKMRHIAIVITYFMNALLLKKENFEWVKRIRFWLFGWNLPMEVKYCLLDCLPWCIQLQEKIESFTIQQWLNNLIAIAQTIRESKETNFRCERTIISDGEENTMIGSSEDIEAIDEFCFRMFEIMIKGVNRVEDKLGYALILFGVLNYFVGYLNQFTPNSWKNTIKMTKICLTYLDEIKNIDVLPRRQKKFLDSFVNATMLVNFLEKCLGMSSVIHPNYNSVCGFCTIHPKKDEAIELKILSFNVILKIYEMCRINSFDRYFSEQGEKQLIESVLIGLRCYTKKSQNEDPITEQNLQQYERDQQLACVLVELWSSYLMRHPSTTESLFSHTDRLKYLVIFQLLQFTNYEKYLFKNHSDQFLDIVDDFYTIQQKQSVKSKIALLLNYISKNVKNSSDNFIKIAQFNLQVNLNFYVFDIWKNKLPEEIVQKISNSSCLMLLLLLNKDFDQKQNNSSFYQFCRGILTRKSLVKMDPITSTLTLLFISRYNIDIFEDKKYQMILNPGLCRNNTLKAVIYQCIDKLSDIIYVPDYLSMYYVDLLLISHLQKRNSNQKWSILNTIVSKHINKFSKDIKMYLIKGIRDNIKNEMLRYIQRKEYDEVKLFNCVDLAVNCTINMAKQQRSMSYVFGYLMEVATLYPYLPTVILKNNVLTLITSILESQNYSGPTTNKLLPILPELLKDYYNSSQDQSYLKSFIYLIQLQSKQKEQKISKELIQLFKTFLHLTKQQVNLSKNYNSTNLYTSLLILQYFIHYLGKSMKKQDIRSLYLTCRSLMKITLSISILARVKNTMFSCSIYLPDVDMYFSIFKMCEENNFFNLESYMLLNTMKKIVSTTQAHGGIEKYEFILKILIIFFEGRLIFVRKYSKKQALWSDVIYKSIGFQLTIDQLFHTCQEIFELFRLQKYKIYIFLMDFIDVNLRTFFMGVEKNIQGKLIYPMVLESYIDKHEKKNRFKNQNQYIAKFIQILEAKISACNPFRTIKQNFECTQIRRPSLRS